MTENTATRPKANGSTSLVVTDPAEAGRRSALSRRARKQEVIDRAERKLEEALERAAGVYVEALEAENADGAQHSVRIAAGDRIFNRLMGMPKQAIEHSGVIEHDVSAARDRLAQLLDRQAAGGEVVEGTSSRAENSVGEEDRAPVHEESNSGTAAPPPGGSE